MDQIVYNITQNIARHRNNPDEFAIVVLGDHGMTLEGNHGGNSLVETRVPVVVITGNGQTVTNKIHKKESQTTANSIGGNVNSIEPAEFVQQTDVTPTLCALLDLDRLPPASFGLSLHPQINKDQRWAAAKLQSGIHQFQRHLSRLNELTDQRKENLKNALDDCMRKTSLLCRLNNSLDTAVTTFNMCKDVMREIQRESIHKITMSNEDDYAPFSIALSAMVLLLSTFHTFGLNLERFNLNVFLLVFIQPILMFSSSFVEQENEIWYFLFPLFLLKILWDDIVYDRRYGMRKMWNFVVRERWLLAAFVLHRLGHAASDGTCRRWLLFSNEKMIDLGLGSINIKHLDSLLGTTILSEDLQVVVATTNILLLNLAFIWRNARSLRLHCLPAIAGFFAVFVYKLPIGLKLVYIERGIQLVLLWLFLTRNFAVAFTLYVIYLMRPLFLSLFLLCCALGFCIGKIRLIKATDGAFLLLSALSASFYYMGNTVSISSIDIAPGYTGLPFYTPFFVGMQILINTYSGPICVFIGWYQATSYLSASAMTSPGRIREILPALLTHRCTALLTVLAASYHFRYHLFVWTVFTPRLLYEVVHFAVFVLFLGGVLIFVPEPYPKNV